MKIAIVGGGMAGLATYVTLKKHLPESATKDITIYERHSGNKGHDLAPPQATTAGETHTDGSPPDRLVIGGGLGLAPNGMRAIRYLSSDLYERVRAAGFRVKSFEMRTSSAGVLGRFPAATEEEDAVMTSWRALWEELRKEIPPGVLEPGKKVTCVESGGLITFEDGDSVQADIVVGADGSRSTCRKAVLEKGEDGDAEFQGLAGFGGFVPTASLPDVPTSGSEVVMTFGQRGFFGYTPCTTDPESDPSKPKPGHTTMWWSTFSSQEPECPLPLSQEARQKLKYLHGDWSDPIIRYIIENSNAELSTAMWTVPKLPRWSKGRVVLIGDAAHALPSTSGQGVSQAMEDVTILGILLGAAFESFEDDKLNEAEFTEAVQRYTRLRKPRVEEIWDEAKRMQGMKREMKWWEMYLVYGFMRLAMKFKSGKAAAKLNEYDASAAGKEEARAWKAKAKT